MASPITPNPTEPIIKTIMLIEFSVNFNPSTKSITVIIEKFKREYPNMSIINKTIKTI